MRKWLSFFLSILLALLPAMACGAADEWSWLEEWLEEDVSAAYDSDTAYDPYDSYESSDSYGGYDGISELFSFFGSLQEGDGYSGGYEAFDPWSADGYGGGDDWLSLLSDALGGSSGSVTAWENPDARAFAETGSPDDTWAVYWYLCGSDLESRYGFATDDMAEMLRVALPDNVTVVIQTGGAEEWQNNFVRENRLQRWLYQGEELSLIDEQPSASMGSAETLAGFLDFCSRHFPADKQAVIFWNHGGGSVTGAAFDEKYGNDSLTLAEMRAAFTAVFEADAQQPPLEMVGFDTCLMATVDVAHTFSDLAKVLVASEETEPANGWDYTTLLQTLAQNPGVNGAQLGRVICDAYAGDCSRTATQGSITLSVIDLQKTAALTSAYEAYGQEVLRASTEDAAFFARFRRAAQKSENYGGNTREEGYSNMVDLGHLARLTADLLPSAQNVLDALDDCVLYRVNGPYRSEATGLSCFYSYDGDLSEVVEYAGLGVSDAFAEYYLYSLTGSLSPAGQALLSMSEQQAQALPAFETLADSGWDGIALSVDENGTACLNLGPQANEILAGIGFQLYFIDQDNDLMLLLGTDNDMSGSWEEGVFYDNFRGVWGSLNGYLVHMSLTFEGDDYNLYTVPILLNGEECHLQVAYDFTSESWSVLGARYGLEESGMAYKDLRLLRRGDEITILWYAASYAGDDEFLTYEAVSFTLEDELEFAESYLMDGLYGMVFEMWDAQGGYAYSQAITFECQNGEVYTYVE